MNLGDIMPAILIPGFDPLQYAIEEAHKRGLELHAWFNTFSVSSSQPGTIPVQHPEWICRDQNGNPMTSYKAASPGLQAVRDYTINVAMEIVRNYDIDGLHLDYVRWNEYDTDDMLDAPSQIEQETKLDGYFSDNTINKLTSPESTNRFLYDVEHPYSAGVPCRIQYLGRLVEMVGYRICKNFARLHTNC